MYSVYFIKSDSNNKIYVGTTSKDPSDRLNEHNSHSNKWSSSNGPFKLVYFESYHCKADALSREKFYKSGFGRRIKKIICDNLK